MKKRKILALILAACLAVFCLAGCGSSSSDSADDDDADTEAAEDSEDEDSDSASTDITGTVATDGSTSMEKVIGYLSEAFSETYTGVTVTYNPTGSGSGITATIEGTCDIGLASRNLKDEEIEEGVEQTVLCYDGISVIVNTENSVSELTLEQISQIFSGEITNWSEVGGDDAEIVVIGREAGSGTRDGFESITDTEDICVYSQELTSTGAVISAVASTPGAIGYASMASVDDSVTTLVVDGVSPSEETVLDGTYAIQRPFVLVTRTDEELSEAAQAFFDYCFTAEAAEYILEAGCVPAFDY